MADFTVLIGFVVHDADSGESARNTVHEMLDKALPSGDVVMGITMTVVDTDCLAEHVVYSTQLLNFLYDD